MPLLLAQSGNLHAAAAAAAGTTCISSRLRLLLCVRLCRCVPPSPYCRRRRHRRYRRHRRRHGRRRRL